MTTAHISGVGNIMVSDLRIERKEAKGRLRCTYQTSYLRCTLLSTYFLEYCCSLHKVLLIHIFRVIRYIITGT